MKTNKTLALLSISCAFILGCKKTEEKAPETKAPPTEPKAAEPAPKPTEAVPAGMTDLSQFDLAMTVKLPPGAKLEGQAGGGVSVLVGDEYLVGISKETSDTDRAYSDKRYREAKGLEVQKSEDLPDGWLITVLRKPKQFDFKRFRSDLGVMCEQRVLPNDLALATGIAICGSLTAK